MPSIRLISPARRVAFRTLFQVESGGFASDLLRLRSEKLDSKDAGLAGEIVFGVLRRQAQLDFLIRTFSGRPVSRLDPEIRIILRMGLYQVRHLDRVPSHAVVTESVELAKEARKRSAAGLVNAVLRKVHRDPIPWPDRATALSQPAWLLERWDQRFGKEIAGRIAGAFLEQPERYLRIPGELPGTLRLAATEVAGCFQLLGGDPAGYRIQDIGAQSIVPLLELRGGQAFLDLCAAPGNKTAQALESGVRAIACDSSEARLMALKALGCPLVLLDATRPLPFRRRFDRILVDAPCSGTGTIGRNPEIRWRLRPECLDRLHQEQVRMLTGALEILAPGGKLVYATCSLETEENEQVVEEALGRLPAKVVRRIPGVDAGDGFFAAVIPSI